MGKNTNFIHNIPPSRIYSGELCNSSIKDLSVFSKTRYVKLKGCRKITDVSMLGNVHYLNLNCCTGITDVSALGRVHTLNLSGCTGITDVSALGRVHTLNLSHCCIKDISILRRVPNLIL